MFVFLPFVFLFLFLFFYFFFLPDISTVFIIVQGGFFFFSNERQLCMAMFFWVMHSHISFLGDMVKCVRELQNNSLSNKVT